MEDRHKKIQAVIVRKNEANPHWDVLLLKTNERRGHFWQNVTGSVDEGELYQDALFREVEEETSITKDNIQDVVDLPFLFEFTDQWKKEVTEKCFLVITKNKYEITLDPGEHVEFKWLPINEVNESHLKYESNYQCVHASRDILENI
jgi:8-oxo-dGTP pyrophosphatase MutT (NUDIX family)